MATDRDWALAYLEQARADFRGMRAMGSVSPSTLAMVCQMVFEKFAKAALLRQGAAPLGAVRRSHRAASRLLLVLRRQRALVAPLGGPRSGRMCSGWSARSRALIHSSRPPSVLSSNTPGKTHTVPFGGPSATCKWRGPSATRSEVLRRVSSGLPSS